jgi:hypothetical protein
MERRTAGQVVAMLGEMGRFVLSHRSLLTKRMVVRALVVVSPAATPARHYGGSTATLRLRGARVKVRPLIAHPLALSRRGGL